MRLQAETGDKAASRKMFDASERRHPIREGERIKAEDTRGRIICIGEDDVLWDTCRCIRRSDPSVFEKNVVSILDFPTGDGL